jgi:pyruvate-ferredoxin/flavodoxin oxidoreductase
MIGGCGDLIPVSALPADGTYPTGTSLWEKRNLAVEVPVWDPDVCIQCGKCVLVCPHAVIRSKVYDPALLEHAPATFKSHGARLPDWKELKYTLQVAAEDCTGCGICVDVCPAKNKSQAKLKAINMRPHTPLRETERANWDFFLTIPDRDRRHMLTGSVREMQVERPLFEFSGACAGCGETPYIKLLTQLFGDRLIIANATGCSSIYGGNLPTTPYAVNAEGRGPAWSNSLFEDNAEFGLGFRVSIDKQNEIAAELLRGMAGQVGEELASQILTSPQRDEADLYAQRAAVAELKSKLKGISSLDARRLEAVADTLVRKSVWIVGGDGWGYDIGYGGLDHVLASGRNVKVLLLDTEVYSNTGGQCSKSTPRGAIAKFASAGKRAPKKDLGLMVMNYGTVYVASVAMGAKDEHTLKAFLEAEAYGGPALIIAYSHCIAHGINMTTGMQNQKAAVQSGQWLLYRYNPEKAEAGENPLHVDSAPPTIPVTDYFKMENRFRMLSQNDPEEAALVFGQAQQDVDRRRHLYEYLAARNGHSPEGAKA